jgi:hypothetical protein
MSQRMQAVYRRAARTTQARHSQLAASVLLPEQQVWHKEKLLWLWKKRKAFGGARRYVNFEFGRRLEAIEWTEV